MYEITLTLEGGVVIIETTRCDVGWDWIRFTVMDGTTFTLPREIEVRKGEQSWNMNAIEGWELCTPHYCFYGRYDSGHGPEYSHDTSKRSR